MRGLCCHSMPFEYHSVKGEVGHGPADLGALLLDPGLIDARKNIAIALYNTGKTKEAIDALQRVLKITPNDADAQEKLKHMETQPDRPNLKR